MKLFMFKSILAAALMFACALAGMQIASGEVHKMKGYYDPKFQRAVAIGGKNEGRLNASILRQDLTTATIEERQHKLEEMKSFSLVSAAAKKVSDGISSFSEILINSLTGK